MLQSHAALVATGSASADRQPADLVTLMVHLRRSLLTIAAALLIQGAHGRASR